jgi:hypothetical protein
MDSGTANSCPWRFKKYMSKKSIGYVDGTRLASFIP